MKAVGPCQINTVRMDEMAAEPLCLSAPLQIAVDQHVTAVAGQEAPPYRAHA